MHGEEWRRLQTELSSGCRGPFGHTWGSAALWGGQTDAMPRGASAHLSWTPGPTLPYTGQSFGRRERRMYAHGGERRLYLCGACACRCRWACTPSGSPVFAGCDSDPVHLPCCVVRPCVKCDLGLCQDITPCIFPVQPTALGLWHGTAWFKA